MLKKITKSFNDKAKSDIYFHVGKFVIEFENMINVVSETMLDFLQKESMCFDDEYLETLVYELDTSSLVTKFLNIYGIKFQDNPPNLELIKKMYCRLQEIIEFRNVLVHNSWEFGADFDYGEIRTWSPKHNKVLDEAIHSHKMKRRKPQFYRIRQSTDLDAIKDYLKQIEYIKIVLLKFQKNSYEENESVRISKKAMLILSKKLNKPEVTNTDEEIKEIVANHKLYLQSK